MNSFSIMWEMMLQRFIIYDKYAVMRRANQPIIGWLLSHIICVHTATLKMPKYSLNIALFDSEQLNLQTLYGRDMSQKNL